jgi:hypothetical protein
MPGRFTPDLMPVGPSRGVNIPIKMLTLKGAKRGVGRRALAYLQLLAYKVALAFALVGGSFDGGLFEEPAKGAAKCAEEIVASSQPRAPALRWVAALAGVIGTDPDSSSQFSSLRPDLRYGHSLPNGLRAPLRC